MKRDPIQKRSIEKKNKIIEAAFSLMQKKGYIELGIRDICKSAKISIGTFYAYYHDKNDLALDLISHYGEKIYGNFARKLMMSVQKKMSLEEVIFQAICKLSEIVQKNIMVHREFEILALQNPDFAKIYHTVENKELVKEISTLLDFFQIESPAEDKQAVIFTIHRTVDEMVKYCIFYGFPIDGERIFHQTAKMIADFLSTESK